MKCHRTKQNLNNHQRPSLNKMEVYHIAAQFVTFLSCILVSHISIFGTRGREVKLYYYFTLTNKQSMQMIMSTIQVRLMELIRANMKHAHFGGKKRDEIKFLAKKSWLLHKMELLMTMSVKQMFWNEKSAVQFDIKQLKISVKKQIKLHRNNIASWEPERHYQCSKMFRWEPEGRSCCTKSMVIAPFWFSTEHLLIVIAPFSGSRSTDNIRCKWYW